MFHFRKFATYSDYKKYMQSGDIYLPRVAMIVNAGDKATSVDKTNDTYGPTWVDFQRADTQFVRVANGGVMLFNDLIAVDGKYDYKAIINEVDNSIEFHVYSTGTTTELAEADADFSEYGIKYQEDGTVVFPEKLRVTYGDGSEFLVEKAFYLDDLARLDDGYVIL